MNSSNLGFNFLNLSKHGVPKTAFLNLSSGEELSFIKNDEIHASHVQELPFF